MFAARKGAANKKGSGSGAAVKSPSGTATATPASTTSIARPSQNGTLTPTTSARPTLQSRPGVAGGSSTAGTPSTSKLVTVTRKVAVNATNSLKERQALARAKRERELQLLEADVRKRQKLSNGGVDDRNSKKSKSKGKNTRLDKGKGRSSEDDSDEGVTVSSRATPRPRLQKPADTTDDEQDDGSDSSDDVDLGTPGAERRKPLEVLRDELSAPKDELTDFRAIHSAELVEDNRKAYIPYFPDLAEDTEVFVEYPGDSARERFLLLRPKVRDQEDYQPVQDILNTIRIICDYFLTDEQARECFKYVRHSSSSALGAFDFLSNTAATRNGSTATSPAPGTRDSTPMSETGTPAPEASTLLAASTSLAGNLSSANRAQGLMRALEKAYRRKNGKDFMEALEWFNVTFRALKEQGIIRQNIIALGRAHGVPETVWMHITGQCYERTVGPRIEELKKYEAFSDNTYGELLPPFVAHIAGLVGLMEDGVMVDMGSGVGNCVVQASMATGCKSYGFENQPAAASIAAAQVNELRIRSRLWGLKHGSCETHEVDFLAAPHLVTPALKTADLVLVNNYVFSPSTNESLSYLFLDLKEGAKVVSLKPFSHANGEVQITERNVGNPTSILVQNKPIRFDRGGVSWTAEGGVFYVAEVNRDRVKKWLEKNGAA